MIPGWGIITPHASRPKKQRHKHHCNKSNKDLYIKWSPSKKSKKKKQWPGAGAGKREPDEDVKRHNLPACEARGAGPKQGQEATAGGLELAPLL